MGTATVKVMSSYRWWGLLALVCFLVRYQAGYPHTKRDVFSALHLYEFFMCPRPCISRRINAIFFHTEKITVIEFESAPCRQRIGRRQHPLLNQIPSKRRNRAEEPIWSVFLKGTLMRIISS